VRNAAARAHARGPWRQPVTIAEGRGQIVQARGFFSGCHHLPRVAGAKVCESPIRALAAEEGGRVPSTAHLQVDIPPGVESGMLACKLRGQGELGDVARLAATSVSRSWSRSTRFFERQRNDLICQVPISFCPGGLRGNGRGANARWSAEHLEVSPRQVKSGDVLRIKGRGMPDIGCRARGDELVENRRGKPAPFDDAQEELPTRIRRDRASPGESSAQEFFSFEKLRDYFH